MGNAAQHCRLRLSQTLQEILKTQNQHQAEFCAFLEVEHLYRSVGCARSKTSVSHSSTESEIISLDAGLRMEGLLALDLWDLVIEVLRTTHGIPKPTQASTREQNSKVPPKIQQVLDQNVDLSNVNQVFFRAHISLRRNHSCTFSKTNEAVLKMFIKGRSPTMRHVSRTHRFALDWLLDRINLDPKVQIKCVECKNQGADILTKGSFTRDEWHNLSHLFNIMNDTTFSCSHVYSHSFLSAGTQSEMSKRSQKSSSLRSPMVKAKACCLVSPQCVSVGQDSSSNPKSPGSTRYSLVWSWEERSAKSGCCSVQHASGNRECGSEDSGGLSETQASGNREYM